MSQNLKMISATKVRSGFTFVEILIVILIIGTLIGVAAPKFRNAFENFEFDSFVKDIFYLSRYLQQGAVSESAVYYLKINRQIPRLEFQAQLKREDGQLQATSGRFSKVYKAPEGVGLESSQPPEIAGIYFYPDGSLDSATLTFQNRQKQKISLSYKGASGVIKIK